MKNIDGAARKAELEDFLGMLFANIRAAVTAVQVARDEWYEHSRQLNPEDLETESGTESDRVKRLLAESAVMTRRILTMEDHLIGMGEVLCSTLPLLDRYTTMAERAQFIGIPESRYKDLGESRGALWMVASRLEPQTTDPNGKLRDGPLFHTISLALHDHPAFSDTDSGWLDILLPVGRVFNGAPAWCRVDGLLQREPVVLRIVGEKSFLIEWY